MGYEADGSLADLFPEDLPERVSVEGTRRVGEMMLEEVRDRTPVAEIPLAYHGNTASWVKDRNGRKPGTLRSAWELSGPVRTRDRTRVTLENPDPVAEYVEDDTRPHLIRARTAKALRFAAGADFRFAKSVRHPGTEGQHMLRDTLAVTEARWPSIIQKVLEEETAG